MIGVISALGGSNIGSVTNALSRLRVGWRELAKPVEMRYVDRLILPGVGAAGPAATSLHRSPWGEVLLATDLPVLGICLGMQLLFEQLTEGGDTCRGLGVASGTVDAFDHAAVRVPHMGWNALHKAQKDDPLLEGVEDGSYVYFVHSYKAPLTEQTVATTSYGDDFTAIVKARNFYGTQFHPEKSGAVGSKILENFSRL